MQKKLLDQPKGWEKLWQGMPEYTQEDLSSFSSLIVHFRNKEDRNKFAELIKQKITHKTKTVWFPEVEIFKAQEYTYTDKNSKPKKLRRRNED